MVFVISHMPQEREDLALVLSVVSAYHKSNFLFPLVATFDPPYFDTQAEEG